MSSSELPRGFSLQLEYAMAAFGVVANRNVIQGPSLSPEGQLAQAQKGLDFMRIMNPDDYDLLQIEAHVHMGLDVDLSEGTSAEDVNV